MTDQPVGISDAARQSGLYILGKPRVGKSWLIVSLILQDIQSGHGVFFLDPHGEAIDDLRSRLSFNQARTRCIILNPEDPEYIFGINPLECLNIEDARLRNDAYSKTKGIFDKLWKNTFEEKPWLQLILQNTLYTLVENQGYTLADLPLFFRDPAFRAFLVGNIRHNRQVKEYWNKTFASKSRRDQDAQMEAAQTRAEIILAHPYVRDIIGQSKSTLNFSKLIEEKKVILLKLSSWLSNEAKKIIGTVVISELVHAVSRRQKRDQFCIFVDEFQNYASFEDFSTLITQAPKYGIATTIAHHERYGQLNQDAGIIGATSAIANKVLFQITPRDADELAPEFAQKPPTERRHEQELTISQEPVADLLRRGHKHPKIHEFVNKLLRPWSDNLKTLKDTIDGKHVIRNAYLDEASLHRDMSTIGRMGVQSSSALFDEANRTSKGEFNRVAQIHRDITDESWETVNLDKIYRAHRKRLRDLDTFFISLMEGRLSTGSWDDRFAQKLINIIGNGFVEPHLTPVFHFYIALTHGAPGVKRLIPGYLAIKYYAKEAEAKYIEVHKDWLTGVSEMYRTGIVAWNIGEKNPVPLDSWKPTYQKFIDEVLQKVHDDPSTCPDLPARVLSPSMLVTLTISSKMLLPREALDLLSVFVSACSSLVKPENHILVPSGQYVYKEMNTRAEADMVNEAIRELTGLEKYTAYAKILSWTGKIRTQTLKTPPDLNPVTMPGWECRNLDDQFLFKKRNKVDAEISARQEGWKPVNSGEPLTTHAEGEQAKAQSSAMAGAGMGVPPSQFSEGD